MFQNTKNIKTVNLKLILKRWDSQSDTWEKQKNFSSSRRMIWYLAPPWLWIHSIVGYQERRERGLSVRDISFCSSLATNWKKRNWSSLLKLTLNEMIVLMKNYWFKLWWFILNWFITLKCPMNRLLMHWEQFQCIAL